MQTKELIIGEGFRVTLFSDSYETPQKTPQMTPQKESLREKILEIIKENGLSTRDDIARRLAIAPDTVKEYLEKLKKEGRLGREGGRKTGHWKIIE